MEAMERHKDRPRTCWSLLERENYQEDSHLNFTLFSNFPYFVPNNGLQEIIFMYFLSVIQIQRLTSFIQFVGQSKPNIKTSPWRGNKFGIYGWEGQTNR